MSHAFCPPKPNPLVIGLLKAFLPSILKYACHGLTVTIFPEDIERLKQYRGERMLLLPNHPGLYDPHIMFTLSAALGEDFRFVAAREIFDSFRGVQGWLLQRAGVYSLVRGKTDRESFKTSKEVLVQGKNRLVVFIEGEISHENDVLIPFESGVIQLAYMALDEVRKKQAGGQLPPLYAVPVGIRYRHNPGAEKAVAAALARLERAVGVAPAEVDTDTYQRFRAIGEKIIAFQETFLSIKPPEAATLNDRIVAVKDKILKRMELFLDIRPEAGAPVLARIRAIRNRMDTLIYTYDDTAHLSEYEHQMVERMRQTLKRFYEDLDRVVQFLTFQEGRVNEESGETGVDRQIELIRRLEKEVFGAPRTEFPRTAVVKAGEVINLADRYQAYQNNRKDTVQGVANDIETNMRRLLEETKIVPLS